MRCSLAALLAVLINARELRGQLHQRKFVRTMEAAGQDPREVLDETLALREAELRANSSHMRRVKENLLSLADHLGIAKHKSHKTTSTTTTRAPLLDGTTSVVEAPELTTFFAVQTTGALGQTSAALGQTTAVPPGASAPASSAQTTLFAASTGSLFARTTLPLDIYFSPPASSTSQSSSSSALSKSVNELWWGSLGDAISDSVERAPWFTDEPTIISISETSLFAQQSPPVLRATDLLRAQQRTYEPIAVEQRYWPFAMPLEPVEAVVSAQSMQPRAEPALMNSITARPLFPAAFDPFAFELVVDKPLIYRQEDPASGDSESVYKRPQVLRKIIDDEEDLVMRNPGSRRTVVLSDPEGVQVYESTLWNPSVRHYRNADEVDAVHLEKPESSERLTFVPDSGRTIEEREMRSPTAIKFELPDSLETIIEHPDVYEAVAAEDGELLSQTRESRRPFVHERVTPNEKHTYVEKPHSLELVTPTFSESWMNKPFAEVVSRPDGWMTSWMERPLVSRKISQDPTDVSPIQPFHIQDRFLRWGPIDEPATIDTLDLDSLFPDTSDFSWFQSEVDGEDSEEFEELDAAEESDWMEPLDVEGELDNEYLEFYLADASPCDEDEYQELLIGAANETKSTESLAERMCAGLSDFPLYYINLQKQPNRRKYMEETFGPRIQRVSATNGTSLFALSDKFQMESEDEYWANPWAYLKQQLKTTPGELGVLVSHLDAIKKAYQDGHATVLIFEDDVGTQLCPMWPTSLTTLKSQADQLYPGWHKIQLQWTPTPSQGQQMKRKWFKTIGETRAAAEARDQTYGQWSEEAVPYTGKLNTLHGNAATLWSRTGLRHVIEHTLSSVVSRTRGGSGVLKWKQPGDTPTVTADAVLKQQPGSLTLFASPPLFAQRFVDDRSALKNELSWRKENVRGSLFALQWFMELQEFYRPGAEKMIPLEQFEFRLKD